VSVTCAQRFCWRHRYSTRRALRPERRTTIRTETKLVLVDAVAQDKKANLRAPHGEEFQNLEDARTDSSVSLESAVPRLSAPISTTSRCSSTPRAQGRPADGSAGGVALSKVSASPDRYMASLTTTMRRGPGRTEFHHDSALLKTALSTVQGSAIQSDPGPGWIAQHQVARQRRKSGTITAQNYRNMLASLRNVVDSLAAIKGRKLSSFSMAASVSGRHRSRLS